MICLLSLSYSFSQSNYLLGYYVNESGQKFVGEISEVDIYNFPETLYFKNGKNVITINKNEISEIKYGIRTYRKKTFLYDNTLSLDIKKMSKTPTFTYTETTDFVEVLDDNAIKLYKYFNNGMFYYFYGKNDQEIALLNYKKYNDDRNGIMENKAYLEQLKKEIPNTHFTSNQSYNLIGYNDQDLVTYFNEINGVKSNKSTKEAKVFFNVYAGYNLNSMDIKFTQDLDAKQYGHFSIKPEVEYVFDNYVKNPSSIFFNIEYSAFKNDFVETFERENWNHSVDYSALSIGVGFKQNFIGSEKIKVYGKLGFVYRYTLKGEILSPVASWAINPIFLTGDNAGLDFGVGTKLFNHLLVEANYQSLFKTSFIEKNNTLSFKIGYTF